MRSGLPRCGDGMAGGGMSALTDRITRMVADAIAGEDVHAELAEITKAVEAAEYRAVMGRVSLTDRRMQAEYQGANDGR